MQATRKDDLHQFDQTIILLKPVNERPRITFNTKLSDQFKTQADFTYKTCLLYTSDAADE